MADYNNLIERLRESAEAAKHYCVSDECCGSCCGADMTRIEEVKDD